MGTAPGTDTVFNGSIPEFYDRHFVPLIFAPYAEVLARRVAARRPMRVLETAAGTGVVTRALAQLLEPEATLVATDLNAAMIERAREVGTARPVEWQTADAMKLPFADASFDVVVCQFGVMFFPDKAHAYAEARRVLKPGGAFVFDVWDRIEDNEFTAVVDETLMQVFPDDPPRFMARTPHGYHDRAQIARDLALGGFVQPPLIETIALRSRADSPQWPAIALCQGSPLRSEIEARGGTAALAKATAACAQALEKRYGSGPVDGKIQAHLVTQPR